jgi:hypothetical protein
MGRFLLVDFHFEILSTYEERFYGFRTNLALKNDYNWFYAQDVASKYILIFSNFLSISMLVKYITGFMFQLLFYTINDTLLLIVATVMIFFLTEDNLRRMWKEKNQK